MYIVLINIKQNFYSVIIFHSIHVIMSKYVLQIFQIFGCNPTLFLLNFLLLNWWLYWWNVIFIRFSCDVSIFFQWLEINHELVEFILVFSIVDHLQFFLVQLLELLFRVDFVRIAWRQNQVEIIDLYVESNTENRMVCLST